MIYRKVLAVIIVASLVFLMSGCGKSSSTQVPASNNQSAPTKVHLVMLAHWPPDRAKLFQTYIDEYEKANPNISIELRTVPFGELLRSISTYQLSGNPPDIYHIYNLWLPSLVKDGVLGVPPKDVVEDVKQAYAAGTINSVQVDGQMYGYPTAVNTYALNYNKRLGELVVYLARGGEKQGMVGGDV